ncbi:MAG: T9SS type A sorting domain-containing protein, partial [Salinivirgaceae bacterium]|nr:T9SS type A sorting domain-containing protein [Salinivirgaceae bacterium]
IAVFPNPNNGKFWLVYEFSSTTTQVVEVINVEGKTVWRDKMDDIEGHRMLIDTENLEKGLYYLEVIDGERQGILKIVIK